MAGTAARGLDQRGTVLRLAHIGTDRNGPPAGRLDQAGGAGQAVHPAGAKRDVGTGLRQCLGKRNPQSGRRTSDDGDLAVQTEVIKRRNGATSKNERTHQ